MGFLYLSLLLASMTFHAMCYPNGLGIDSACNNLLPSHGPSSQPSAAPYTITFNPTSFTPGQTVTVTLTTPSGGWGFKGFMIQARRADTNQNQEFLGSFTGGSATRQACSGKALVHSSNTFKTSLIFNWIAPSTSVGNITFRVTYVQNFDVFWVNRVSGVLIEAIPTTAGYPTTTTTTTYHPTTTRSYPPTTTTAYHPTTTRTYPSTTRTYPSKTATLIKDSTTTSDYEVGPGCTRFCHDGINNNNYCLSCCWGMVIERYRNVQPINSKNSRYLKARQTFLNGQVKQCMKEFMEIPYL